MKLNYISPVGNLAIRIQKGLLTELTLSDGSALGKNNPDLNEECPENRTLAGQIIAQLDEYFAGKRKEFDLPLSLDGTDFQKKVWHELQQIPYGQAISYKELSSRVKGNPNASRAVGNANGKNPVAIIVPCHRVIAHDGSLGGYSLGLEMKKKLLKLEAIECSKPLK